MATEKQIPVKLVFDIGKTNKKALIFNSRLELLHVEESKFEETVDDDGYPCDDIEKIEAWLFKTVEKISRIKEFVLTHINFTTYGATLVFLDKDGKRLTPLYNYLKPVDGKYAEELYEKYGGKTEFLRKTASPALGMLNSGMQILWLKRTKPEIFGKVKHILHFPQYLSYLFTGKIKSELTSIGCHTAMWDFDNNKYHEWLSDEGIELPTPSDINEEIPVKIYNKEVKVGIGLHDSSASLIPYLKSAEKKFVLISTGTWCINMNPFNNSPLTLEELNNDCLNFMSYEGKPVKSSRLFLGHIHDVNVKRMAEYFDINTDFYKNVNIKDKELSDLLNKKILFFKNSVPVDYIERNVDYSQFSDYRQAYKQLVIDLARLTSKSIDLIIKSDEINQLFITGGFAGNTIFTKNLAKIYDNKEVYVSNMHNSTSVGAALTGSFVENINVNLGLTMIK